MAGNCKTWYATAGETAGSGHLSRGLPCQDRAGAWTSPRPCLVVLDGRGSSERSQQGAQLARLRIREEIIHREDELSRILDRSNFSLAALGWQGVAQSLYHRAAHEQVLLAEWYQVPSSEYEFTLSLAVVGEEFTGWFSVGDSPLIVASGGITGLVTFQPPSRYANETRFVSASIGDSPGITGGIIPSALLSGIIGMSDGAASKLVHTNDHYPAQAINQIIKSVSEGRSLCINTLLRSTDWDHVTRDDRCMAMIVRNHQ